VWHFLIPEHGADRMGRDGALYEMAQWYPRVAVYDDVAGWNTEPYLGQGEFYLDYGDYTLAITVSRRIHRGRHRRAHESGEVLTPAQQARLAAAAATDTVVRVVTQEELSAAPLGPAATARSPGASPPRTCATRSGRLPRLPLGRHQLTGRLRVRVLPPQRGGELADAADQARMSIQEYSERWLPTPGRRSPRSRGRSAGWNIR
jgi:hypothetical protein